MVKKTAWVLLKNYFILSLVSALLIKFSGGNGLLGYTEFVATNILILYMNYKSIKKLILAVFEE